MKKVINSAFVIALLILGTFQANAKEFKAIVGDNLIAKPVVKNVSERLGVLTIEIFKNGDESQKADQVIEVGTASLKYAPKLQIGEDEGKDAISIVYKNNYGSLIGRVYSENKGQFQQKATSTPIARDTLANLVVTGEDKLEIHIYKLSYEDFVANNGILGEPEQVVSVSEEKVDPTQTLDIERVSGNDIHVTYYSVPEKRIIAHMFTMVDGKLVLITAK